MKRANVTVCYHFMSGLLSCDNNMVSVGLHLKQMTIVELD